MTQAIFQIANLISALILKFFFFFLQRKKSTWCLSAPVPNSPPVHFPTTPQRKTAANCSAPCRAASPRASRLSCPSSGRGWQHSRRNRHRGPANTSVSSLPTGRTNAATTTAATVSQSPPRRDIYIIIWSVRDASTCGIFSMI